MTDHPADSALAAALEHIPPSGRARALIDHHSAIADQFVNPFKGEQP
ncbi:hypothetical protein GS490_15865 [Rhodococcus hoagii]|nr:hypothetical protein [Prescottella equi]